MEKEIEAIIKKRNYPFTFEKKEDNFLYFRYGHKPFSLYLIEGETKAYVGITEGHYRKEELMSLLRPFVSEIVDTLKHHPSYRLKTVMGYEIEENKEIYVEGIKNHSKTRLKRRRKVKR